MKAAVLSHFNRAGIWYDYDRPMRRWSRFFRTSRSTMDTIMKSCYTATKRIWRRGRIMYRNLWLWPSISWLPLHHTGHGDEQTRRGWGPQHWNKAKKPRARRTNKEAGSYKAKRPWHWLQTHGRHELNNKTIRKWQLFPVPVPWSWPTIKKPACCFWYYCLKWLHDSVLPFLIFITQGKNEELKVSMTELNFVHTSWYQALRTQQKLLDQ